MQITLTQQDVIDSLKFDRSTILGFEQDGVPQLNTAHIWANGHDLRPVQSAPDLCRCGNDNAPTGLSFTVLRALTNQYPVVQEFDGDRPVGSGTSVGCGAR